MHSGDQGIHFNPSVHLANYYTQFPHRAPAMSQATAPLTAPVSCSHYLLRIVLSPHAGTDTRLSSAVQNAPGTVHVVVLGNVVDGMESRFQTLRDATLCRFPTFRCSLSRRHDLVVYR
jgi:hypothetical protein